MNVATFLDGLIGLLVLIVVPYVVGRIANTIMGGDDDELKALLKQLPQDRKRELINTIKNAMTNTVDVNKE